MEFQQYFSKNFVEMIDVRQSRKFHFEGHHFRKNVEGVPFILHKLVMNIFQTKPQIKRKNISFFDVYFTIIFNLLKEGEN